MLVFMFSSMLYYLFVLITYFQKTIGVNVEIHTKSDRTFQIDYDNDVFLKDGKPFQYVAGSLHYFRVPKVYWRDRLKMLKAAGLNVVSTYVEWSSHEPVPREYQFQDDTDLEHFLYLAAQEDLLVILRPGPYICAGRDFGGFPPWLLNKYPWIQLRTEDQDFKNEVGIWFDVLFKKIKNHLYGNGGPIILVQVENKYGSYGRCNEEYKIWLRDLILLYVENKTVLFTTDEPLYETLECGAIPNVLSTIYFGWGDNVQAAFNSLRSFAPKGPLVNSEFYTRRFTLWGNRKRRISRKKVVKKIEEMLDRKASFNLYMFSGGTNFGFMNGATYENETVYKPQITSYDCDAPITEAGDATKKYYAIRSLLLKHFKLPDVDEPEHPEPTEKGNYGPVTLEPVLSIFNYSYIRDKVIEYSITPMSFEQLGVYYGYVLYETMLPNDSNYSKKVVELYVPRLRDRANVFLDQGPSGVLSRTKQTQKIALKAKPNAKLHFLVENQGRLSAGYDLRDFKGMLSLPLFDGLPLISWSMIGLPLADVSWLRKLTPSSNPISPPAYYYGEFMLPEEYSEPLHTYVNLTGWGKGVIFINNNNLGRYWPSMEPKTPLFVPASYLKPAQEMNKIVVFETEKTPKALQVSFVSRANEFKFEISLWIALYIVTSIVIHHVDT